MLPVKLINENLNLEESYISLINNETQTDATDSFLENLENLRFHRSQNPSAVQSENSKILLSYCQKRGDGTVTIKNNTIIIKEPLRRHPTSLVRTISQNTELPGISAYCEEVVEPYLKTPLPDCELYERLAIDISEDSPNQHNSNAEKAMKDKKAKSDVVCESPDQLDSNAEKAMKDKKAKSDVVRESPDPNPPCDKPETTELIDLVAKGLKNITSALFSPICQNCVAKKGDKAERCQEDDPCKKSSSHKVLDAMGNVSQRVKKVASKIMTPICPKKSSDQCEAPPPKKKPEAQPITPPEKEVAKSDSCSSVKGAYGACKTKTLGVAKGIRRSLSNLLCTPCPCPQPCEPGVCSSTKKTATPTKVTAAPLVDDRCKSEPKEEDPPGPFVEKTHNVSDKKDEGPPPCPVVKELPPCPIPEEKLPCQPLDIELPPCSKKLIERPPCPPQDDKPYCPPKKKAKKCPPKQGTCTPVDKCKIKDPVMAVRMPKCKGEKPLYYLTDRSKICKDCLEKSSKESMSNTSAKNVAFDATKCINVTELNNEIKPDNQINSDFVNKSDTDSKQTSSDMDVTDDDIDIRLNNEAKPNLAYENTTLFTLEYKTNDKTEPSQQTNNPPRVLTVGNEINSNDTPLNFENDSSTNTGSSQSEKVADIISLKNDQSSNNIDIDIDTNGNEEISLKVRLGKPLTDAKDSMSNLVHTICKDSEPTLVLSEESQLIKVTETASTEKKFPGIMNVNQHSDAVNDGNVENEESEASAMERASIMMAPIVARLAGAVDTTMTSLKEHLDLDRFSSTAKDSVRENTESSSPYDKRSNASISNKELRKIDSEPVSDEPSSLTKSVFTTIKSKLFGMFSDRERETSSTGPVLQKTSKASVRFKNSEGSLD